MEKKNLRTAAIFVTLVLVIFALHRATVTPYTNPLEPGAWEGWDEVAQVCATDDDCRGTTFCNRFRLCEAVKDGICRCSQRDVLECEGSNGAAHVFCPEGCTEEENEIARCR